MNTAVFSDLHLGTARGHDLVRRPAASDAFLAAVEEADRVILLGDALELRDAPVAAALDRARPFLGALGRAVGDRELVLVPGNHDHALVRPLTEAARVERRPLGLETRAAPAPGGLTAAVAEALAPARPQIAYPGVWVRDDVYATHGHHLDVHNTVPAFERLAIGAVQRATGRLPDGPLTAEQYEDMVEPVYAAAYALAQRAGNGPPRGAGSSTRVWQLLNSRNALQRIPARTVALAGVAAFNLAGLGPVKPDLTAEDLRRAGLRAMGEALDRLGVRAAHAIFGHTHRSGPRPQDDGAEWAAPSGTRLLNSGSWVHEPPFLGDGDPRESPYFPGTCVWVPAEGAPELRRLLDRLPTGT